MQPPPPPGEGSVRLYTRAHPSDRPGFCERIVIEVHLKANASTVGGRGAEFTPDRIALRIAYWWAGAARACEAPRSEFFSPDPSGTDRALAMVRRLAWAKAQAEKPGALPFQVFVDDREATQLQAYARAHPEFGPYRGLDAVTDGKAALRRLPLGRVDGVFRADRASPNPLTASDLAEIAHRRLQADSVFLGSDWTATLLLDGDRIVRVRLRREMPPPF
jgi:hypothetical protein